MGLNPTHEHTLERLDNDKGYNPENCIWDTKTNQNLNQRVRKNNRSGVRGVCWSRFHSKWCASIGINKKRKHLGYFKNIKCAETVYLNAYYGQWKKYPPEYKLKVCHPDGSVN